MPRFASIIRAPIVAAALFAGATGVATALEIDGVEPYALDQPRVTGSIRPEAGGYALAASGSDWGESRTTFDCFLDTGASRMVLSRADRDAFGVRAAGETVEDVGIAGRERFDVSLPYRLVVTGSTSTKSRSRELERGFPCTMQLRRTDPDPLAGLPPGALESLMGGAGAAGFGMDGLGDLGLSAVNIVGTPFLAQHVAILDPTPVSSAFGSLGSMLGGGGGSSRGGGGSSGDLGLLLQLLERLGAGAGGSSSGGVPSSTPGRIGVEILPSDGHYSSCLLVVPLTLRSLEPASVPVSTADLPFVAGVEFENRYDTVRADLLLDTGGGTSLISSRLARSLGINVSYPEMTALVQGVGGRPVELGGHWIDRLTLPTERGAPIVYRRVPVFVADIEGIDGTLGANLFLPSVWVDASPDALAGDLTRMFQGMRAGPMPYRRVVIDLPGGKLGLDPS